MQHLLLILFMLDVFGVGFEWKQNIMLIKLWILYKCVDVLFVLTRVCMDNEVMFYSNNLFTPGYIWNTAKVDIKHQSINQCINMNDTQASRFCLNKIYFI
jgi:hypothetical protein